MTVLACRVYILVYVDYYHYNTEYLKISSVGFTAPSEGKDVEKGPLSQLLGIHSCDVVLPVSSDIA